MMMSPDDVVHAQKPPVERDGRAGSLRPRRCGVGGHRAHVQMRLPRIPRVSDPPDQLSAADRLTGSHLHTPATQMPQNDPPPSTAKPDVVSGEVLWIRLARRVVRQV